MVLAWYFQDGGFAQHLGSNTYPPLDVLARECDFRWHRCHSYSERPFLFPRFNDAKTESRQPGRLLGRLELTETHSPTLYLPQRRL